MPELTMLGAFAVATVVLVALPGPNSIYILTRGATQGRRAGVVSALGVEAGTLVHVLVAVAGLSALVASSPVAMTVLTVAGAGYLCYLGIGTLVRRGDSPEAQASPVPLGRVFRAGVLMNLLNPKVVLFFLAFLPQFVSSTGDARTQMLVFGVLFLLVAFAMDLGYAVAGSALRGALGARPTLSRCVTATVYLGLAAYTVLS